MHTAVRASSERGVCADLDFTEHLVVVVTVERREPTQQNVDDDADGPQIDLQRAARIRELNGGCSLP